MHVVVVLLRTKRPRCLARRVGIHFCRRNRVTVIITRLDPDRRAPPQRSIYTTMPSLPCLCVAAFAAPQKTPGPHPVVPYEIKAKRSDSARLRNRKSRAKQLGAFERYNNASAPHAPPEIQAP